MYNEDNHMKNNRAPFDIKAALKRVYFEAAGRMNLSLTEGGLERAVERASQIILEEAAVEPTINKAPASLRPAELWANRPNKRGESPAAWVKRVYAAELAAGTLTRAAILEADQPLYQAYATWIRRHPEDDLEIPTRSEITTAELEILRHPDGVERSMRAARLQAAARMREIRKKC